MFQITFIFFLPLHEGAGPAGLQRFFITMDPRTPRWIALGFYYGYPHCCIFDFITRLNTGDPYTSDQGAVCSGLGFIPCQECSSKIINAETTLKGLIKDRICKTSFPDEGPEDQLNYFVEYTTLIIQMKLNETTDLLF